MAVHDNHRSRVKEKFLRNGLDGMHDHEVLELLLFYAIPRIDVNPIAHRLMKRFTTLHAVLEATVEQLCMVEGIGENSALLIHLAMQLMRRYGVDRKTHHMLGACLKSTDDIGDYVLPHFFGLGYELVIMLCVDHKGAVLSCEEISRGTIDEASISVRKIVEIALLQHAHGVVLAHNHPHGTALPSLSDVQTTREVQAALRLVNIQMLDHIIVADIAETGDGLRDDYVSMRESGQL